MIAGFSDFGKDIMISKTSGVGATHSCAVFGVCSLALNFYPCDKVLLTFYSLVIHVDSPAAATVFSKLFVLLAINTAVCDTVTIDG